MLCYHLSVGLNCAVVVFGAPGSSVGAEEGVMVHTGPPKVLTGLGTGQSQRHLTILGLPLPHAEFRFFVKLYNVTLIFKVTGLLCDSGYFCLIFFMNYLLLFTQRNLPI